ncbi:unnamed protein product [Nyctereutes procyonoides]|uniref:(raccoon dog) hypothetical protein n=1 Tax=Nyctereutes procyonoides TaxID=34880 RepID=A0A811XZ07_NYCPR|nr:unnamed protein product [Nyctereutes procyonoides]
MQGICREEFGGRDWHRKGPTGEGVDAGSSLEHGLIGPPGVKEQRLVSWAQGQLICSIVCRRGWFGSNYRAGITVRILHSENERTCGALSTDSGRKHGSERASRQESGDKAGKCWSAGLDLPWDLLHFCASYQPGLLARPSHDSCSCWGGEGAAGSGGKHIPWEIRSEIAPNPDHPAPALHMASPLCKQGRAEPSLRRSHSHAGFGKDFICSDDTMELESIMLRKINHSEKGKYHMISLIYGI